jgi:hypothetical protein
MCESDRSESNNIIAKETMFPYVPKKSIVIDQNLIRGRVQELKMMFEDS